MMRFSYGARKLIKVEFIEESKRSVVRDKDINSPNNLATTLKYN